jgi:hypothetical protein
MRARYGGKPRVSSPQACGLDTFTGPAAGNQIPGKGFWSSALRRAPTRPGCPRPCPRSGSGAQSRRPWTDSGAVSSHRGVQGRAAHSRSAFVFPLTARTRAARWRERVRHAVKPTPHEHVHRWRHHGSLLAKSVALLQSCGGPRARRDERPRTSEGARTQITRGVSANQAAHRPLVGLAFSSPAATVSRQTSESPRSQRDRHRSSRSSAGTRTDRMCDAPPSRSYTS